MSTANPRRPIQLSLPALPPPRLAHGGDERKGRRKLERPLDPRRALHLTLRSSRARGPWSLLHPRHRLRVERLAQGLAEKWELRLYRFVNVGNHLHLIVKAPDRARFQGFLREFSGRVAMVITGACKGRPAGRAEGGRRRRFWDRLAWSRVVSFGREFRVLLDYIVKNRFEAAGALTLAAKKRGYRVITLERDPPE